MVKKEIWGTATWYLFYTLSYKLKHDNEQQVKTLYNHFKNFCNHLPCPICKEHAMRFLAKVNDNNIKTKDNLIIIMFTFHNEVNRMTNSKYSLWKSIINYMIKPIQMRWLNILLMCGVIKMEPDIRELNRIVFQSNNV